MNDKISELIINIKNATLVKKEDVVVEYSKFKEAILNLLKKENYIADYKVLKGDGVKKNIRITLSYDQKGNSKITDVKRISKLSKRVYYGYKDILPVKYGKGLLVLSTPKGIISDKQAKKEKIGGEALFKVW
ncbi:30S ribosomal protein S8 [Candidatus Campbellbacteria bacterium]|nr:MAG: 30S ribosomal protein S8 [Candidatus Campbellbacteria bacterium]